MHELLELKIPFKNLDEILYHEVSSDEIKNPDILKLLNIMLNKIYMERSDAETVLEMMNYVMLKNNIIKDNPSVLTVSFQNK
jgi:hypothetical protein